LARTLARPLTAQNSDLKAWAITAFCFFFPFQLTKVLDSKVPSNRVHEALADM